jgi:hypothetical protein
MSSGTERDEEQTESRGGLGAVLRLRIELWVVVVFMALAFGAGVLVTALYDQPQEPVVGFQQPAGQLPAAPPLTDQQIQGGLPSGHPDVGDATGPSGPTGQSAQGEAPGTGGGN